MNRTNDYDDLGMQLDVPSSVPGSIRSNPPSSMPASKRVIELGARRVQFSHKRATNDLTKCQSLKVSAHGLTCQLQLDNEKLVPRNHGQCTKDARKSIIP